MRFQILPALIGAAFSISCASSRPALGPVAVTLEREPVAGCERRAVTFIEAPEARPGIAHSISLRKRVNLLGGNVVLVTGGTALADTPARQQHEPLRTPRGRAGTVAAADDSAAAESAEVYLCPDAVYQSLHHGRESAGNGSAPR